MGAPVPIRDDLAAEALRRLARQQTNGRVACRLLGVAHGLDGISRERAARPAGMDRQTLRDWVIRFKRGRGRGLARSAQDKTRALFGAAADFVRCWVLEAAERS